MLLSCKAVFEIVARFMSAIATCKARLAGTCCANSLLCATSVLLGLRELLLLALCEPSGIVSARGSRHHDIGTAQHPTATLS